MARIYLNETNNIYYSYANKFGVNTADFYTDFDSDAIAEKTDQDLQFGLCMLARSFVGFVPSFFM